MRVNSSISFLIGAKALIWVQRTHAAKTNSRRRQEVADGARADPRSGQRAGRRPLARDPAARREQRLATGRQEPGRAGTAGEPGLRNRGDAARGDPAGVSLVGDRPGAQAAARAIDRRALTGAAISGSASTSAPPSPA